MHSEDGVGGILGSGEIDKVEVKFKRKPLMREDLGLPVAETETTDLPLENIDLEESEVGTANTAVSTTTFDGAVSGGSSQISSMAFMAPNNTEVYKFLPKLIAPPPMPPIFNW